LDPGKFGESNSRVTAVETVKIGFYVKKSVRGHGLGKTFAKLLTRKLERKPALKIPSIFDEKTGSPRSKGIGTKTKK